MRHAGARKSVEVGLEQRAKDLAHPVGAEVETQDAVAVPHPLIVADRGRDDELVERVVRVGVAHGVDRSGEMRAVGVHQGVVGLGHAVPALVAVHGVVAAADGDDPHADRQRIRQPRNIVRAGLRRRVPPVGKGVHHGRHPGRLQQLGQRDRMVLMRVHATR